MFKRFNGFKRLELGLPMLVFSPIIKVDKRKGFRRQCVQYVQKVESTFHLLASLFYNKLCDLAPSSLRVKKMLQPFQLRVSIPFVSFTPFTFRGKGWVWGHQTPNTKHQTTNPNIFVSSIKISTFDAQQNHFNDKNPVFSTFSLLFFSLFNGANTFEIIITK
jgi:hypothetical protein